MIQIKCGVLSKKTKIKMIILNKYLISSAHSKILTKNNNNKTRTKHKLNKKKITNNNKMNKNNFMKMKGANKIVIVTNNKINYRRIQTKIKKIPIMSLQIFRYNKQKNTVSKNNMIKKIKKIIKVYKKKQLKMKMKKKKMKMRKIKTKIEKNGTQKVMRKISNLQNQI